MEQVKKAEIMDEGAMRRAINRISYEIIEHNHGAVNLILAGIRTRGVFLAERMADKMEEVEGTRPRVIALDITGFRDDRPGERLAAQLPQMGDISNTTVIIVDDVLSTGRTVRAAMEAVLHMGRAQRIQLAALIDRGHRELPIRPDYIGKNLPTSRAETVRVFMQEFDGKDSVVIMKDAAASQV
ncbi:MAG: bifunctional pyr operon transcriptional regulator/uracil phosphoribosyltransferase PyrR [Eubacteriales bacterium]|nr:bifunctional pyr operon transcriptional regulator/uracil phosphoribosyltransferase PyrR [Eubacteriales bacterium]